MDEPTTDIEVPSPRERLTQALELGPGEELERAYVFDAIERGGVAFLLTLVTKRRADGRLEMAALGGRVPVPGGITFEFTRRARFPDEVLPSILTELIDRCGAEGAAYREIDLEIRPGSSPEQQVAALLERILPADRPR